MVNLCNWTKLFANSCDKSHRAHYYLKQTALTTHTLTHHFEINVRCKHYIEWCTHCARSKAKASFIHRLKREKTFNFVSIAEGKVVVNRKAKETNCTTSIWTNNLMIFIIGFGTQLNWLQLECRIHIIIMHICLIWRVHLKDPIWTISQWVRRAQTFTKHCMLFSVEYEHCVALSL